MRSVGRAIYGEHPGTLVTNHLTGAVQMWQTPRSPKYGHDLEKFNREPSRKNPTWKRQW